MPKCRLMLELLPSLSAMATLEVTAEGTLLASFSLAASHRLECLFPRIHGSDRAFPSHAYLDYWDSLWRLSNY